MDDLGDLLACRIARFVRDDGSVIEVEMTVALAKAIRKLDDAARKKEERRRRRETTFTDAGVHPNGIARPHVSPRRAGNPWEGPRFAFTWLVGESRTWDGPPDREPCPFCHGGWLPALAYCLGCDRTGRDNMIDRPGRTEVARLRARAMDDGLKGGL